MKKLFRWLRCKYHRLGWIMAGRPTVTLAAGGNVHGMTFHNITLNYHTHELAPESIISQCWFYNKPGVRIWTEDDTEEYVRELVRQAFELNKQAQVVEVQYE